MANAIIYCVRNEKIEIDLEDLNKVLKSKMKFNINISKQIMYNKLFIQNNILLNSKHNDVPSLYYNDILKIINDEGIMNYKKNSGYHIFKK